MYTVIVLDDAGNEVLRKEADLTQLDVQDFIDMNPIVDDGTTTGWENIVMRPLTVPEVALTIASPEICPFECDSCRG